MRAERLATGPEDEGKRLDAFLAAAFPDLSRAHHQRLIEEGHVLVDGRPRKPAYKLRPGEDIDITFAAATPIDVPAQTIPIAILYQDADLAVIDKPAGLVVHPAPGHSSGTVVNALLDRLPDLSGIRGSIRPGIVHRLDKDTSGVMVVAKHDRAQQSLVDQLKARTVHKEYVALVAGEPSPPEGIIDAPIARDPHDRKRMAVISDGREARTRYATEERFGRSSLVRAFPETGRTHQIRVHLAAIGHPVAGDPVYSSGPTRRLAPRQFLHAERLTFAHPRSGEMVTFEAPLPEELVEVLRRVRREAGR
ncbi:MAG TPA: RluA family pseudouridine synthase [Dehalococcoidia bacterium]|nr:RluA family pseudouridine synthase [Dehalococcoidia bacterium]